VFLYEKRGKSSILTLLNQGKAYARKKMNFFFPHSLGGLGVICRGQEIFENCGKKWEKSGKTKTNTL
jgi:hypothetical protein